MAIENHKLFTVRIIVSRNDEIQFRVDSWKFNTRNEHLYCSLDSSAFAIPMAHISVSFIKLAVR
jgi:hypothetical protein